MAKPKIETIKLTQPYDLKETLYSGQAFRWRQLEPYKHTEGIWHEGFINSIRVRLSQVGNTINIEFDPKHKEFVIQAVETYLRVEDDMFSIYDTMSSDQYLKNCKNKRTETHRTCDLGSESANQSPFEVPHTNPPPPWTSSTRFRFSPTEFICTNGILSAMLLNFARQDP